MMGGGMMDGYGFGLIGLILTITIIVGFVMFVTWSFRRLTYGTANWQQSSGDQSPREILQARYARGEITRDQYQQMLQDLD